MKFSFVFSADGNPNIWGYGLSIKEAQGIFERLLDKPIMLSDDYEYLSKESSDEVWQNLKSFQVSGIITKKEFLDLLSDLGAFPSKCHTLGTLDGPLGIGIYPDVDFTIVSEVAIFCLRVTPIPEKGGEALYVSERNWNRLEKAMWNL